MKVNLRWTQRKKEVRNEENRLRLRKLRNWEVRMRFQTELMKLFEEARNRLIDDAEEVCKVFKEAILALTERVAGRQRKTTSWWSNGGSEEEKAAVQKGPK